jgi:hypothetical protein
LRREEKFHCGKFFFQMFFSRLLQNSQNELDLNEPPTIRINLSGERSERKFKWTKCVPCVRFVGDRQEGTPERIVSR